MYKLSIKKLAASPGVEPSSSASASDSLTSTVRLSFWGSKFVILKPFFRSLKLVELYLS